MRSATLLSFFVLTGVIAHAQSESFVTLKNKFSGVENVHSFSTSGFLARTALWLAGEHEFNDAVKEIRNVRFITIPKTAFAEQQVTLNGFKKIVRRDSYQELACVRDHGDEVTLYIQTATRSKTNRYLVLVDNDNDVVAIEIKGYIDPDIMLKNSHVSYQQ
jgi:hypothetical protein